VKTGAILKGRKIAPERIREDRKPYYRALRECDTAWEDGRLDLTRMEDYLAGLLQAQLEDDGLPPQCGMGPAQPHITSSS
jgi:hypothetical protein